MENFVNSCDIFRYSSQIVSQKIYFPKDQSGMIEQISSQISARQSKKYALNGLIYLADTSKVKINLRLLGVNFENYFDL